MTFSLTATPPGRAGDRAVEGDAVVHPVDHRGRREARAGAAVGVRAEAGDLKVERDRPGDALEGEVALKDEAFLAALEGGGREGHRRVLLDLEEVGAADVRVALLLAGVDRGQVNRGRDRRGQWVFGGDDRALELVEAAAHLLIIMCRQRNDTRSGPGRSSRAWLMCRESSALIEPPGKGMHLLKCVTS